MRLLRAMMALQESEGAVSDAALHKLARAEHVPLHRLQGLRSFYPVFREQPGAPVQVHVCRDVVCRMAGGASHCARVREALHDRTDVEVTEVSCLGLCDQAPAAHINDTPVQGSPEEIRAFASGERALPEAAANGEAGSAGWPADPYQNRTEHFAALRSLLGSGTPEGVIQALKDSGLRGLGGAAFPTGMKWEFTRAAPGAEKYVICNADESEPGTFKDRVILEQQAHLVLEGMIIAAWVIGARRGIVYLRHEYHRAGHVLAQAMDQARRAGVLGDAVCGSGFGFDLELFVSPGGYILGEETALLEALEDRRGEPRNKPPFPTTAGLYGMPTLMNNVETFAAVPAICRRGAQWWVEQGADQGPTPGMDQGGVQPVGRFKGLKYVSVSGDVARPGVHCVPWGTTAAQVLALCGGMRDGRAVKAFSPGGASTAFLPADKLDTPLDWDAMQAAGSALGTGAMLFVAAHRDLLDVTLSQVRFFRNESCGKCVPCRVGSHKAVEMVEQAMAGHNNASCNDAEPALQQFIALQDLHETLAKTSICGLGQVALLPLVDALKTFSDDPSLKSIKGDGACV